MCSSGFAVDRSTPDSPAQLWSCRALALLGRLDVILALASALSPEAVATAVAVRYTSWRDSGAHPLPLDYKPLEDYLSGGAEVAQAIGEELEPGRGYCAITSSEVPEALRAAASPHALVRRHAVCVLGGRALGEAAGRVVIPHLREAARSDPDDEVRRLAGLSLPWWKADQRTA